MPSILPNFEYDIFISYRHNDNRSGGVTEFVEFLKEELAVTIKEPLSVYFDTNPHDGLLANHDVDKSLERKLKCLIFIPIISQTYCDPKCFAWEHEFVAFNNLAKEDSLGRDILLNNGNIASRILPVKIHELDAEDTATIENEIGGVLRSLEFIYKEPGVNRPLKVTDERRNNQNQTDYSNQVNKVANAAKELIAALKNDKSKAITIDTNDHFDSRENNLVKKSRKKYALASVIGLVVLLIVYWALNSASIDDTAYEYDVAVMYLENLTEDEKYAAGLINLIDINLAEDPNLKMAPRHKLYETLKDLSPESKAPDQSVARQLASSMGARLMITGSVIQQLDQVLANVNLIEVSSGKVIASKKVQGRKEQIFDLANNITTQLMLGSTLEREYNVAIVTTGNYEAYKEYYEGLEHFWDLEFNAASDKFGRAIQLDSSFTSAYLYKAVTINPFGIWDIYRDIKEGDPFIQMAIRNSKQMPEKEQLIAQALNQYANDDSDFKSTLSRLLAHDPNDKFAMLYASAFMDLDQLSLLTAYIKRNPSDQVAYNNLAYASMRHHQIENAKRAVDEYLRLGPNLFNSYHSSWEIYLMAGDFQAALAFAETIEDRFIDNKSRGAWKGISYLTTHQPDMAMDVYNKYRDSTNLRDFVTIGSSAYLMQGKFSNSLRLLNEETKRLADENEPLLSLFAKTNRPLVLSLSGKHNESNLELDELIEEAEKELEYNPFLFIGQYYKGLNFIALNNFSSGRDQLNILTKYIQTKKYDARFRQYVALLEAELELKFGNLDKVHNALKKLKLFETQNNPKYFEIYLQYLMQAGKNQEALSLADNLHYYLGSGRPGYGGNQTLYTINLMFQDYHRGLIYEKLGQPDKAVGAYNSFLDLLKDSDEGIVEKEDAALRMAKIKKEQISPN